jgi:two-component system LytT family sensor kinase
MGLPWAFEKKLVIWWRLPLLFFLAQAVYIILHYLADLALIGLRVITSDGPYKLSYQFILKNLYRGSYFLGFSTGYFLLKMRDLERAERERLKALNFETLLKQQQTEKELSITQNAFLKAQINPHFLFNTLDFVYHNIHPNPDEAADAVIYLSRMMRFAIDSNDQGEFIRIAEEIRHVQTLVDLYSLRKKDINLPEITYAQEVASLNFIPLVILTLAENMIKHGRFNVQSDSSYMKLEIADGLFVIKTKNLIDRHHKKIQSGAGLKNVENRLKFAYGESVSFKYYEDDDNHFLLSITIPKRLLHTNAE